MAQQRAGELLLIPVHSTSGVGLIRISRKFAPGGPLGWLVGARAVLSASLRDFNLRFGRP